MPGITIPTTAQLVASYKAAIESRLNQNTPPNDKSYNNVIATIEAMGDTVAYKYAADRAAANLWISAVGNDLDTLGEEYNLPRFFAVSAIVSASLPASDGTIIPIGTVFTSSVNSIQYTVVSTVTAPSPGGTGTGVVIELRATVAGALSNLSNGSTLTIQSPIAGANGVAVVLSTVTTGTDDEQDSTYRVRGLSVVQTSPNGSNAAAYRAWGQSVNGVVAVYPYAGPFFGSGLSPLPGMRTCYIECSTTIEADGICPGTWDESTETGTGLLSQVAGAIITNPNTGIGNQDLGLVNSTLYIKPIRRTPIYIQITQGVALSSDVKGAIDTAIGSYLLSIKPYVQGVDPSFSRNDTITNTIVSSIVQNVLVRYGVFIQAVGFGTTAGLFLLSYQLGAGELVKLGAVSYV